MAPISTAATTRLASEAIHRVLARSREDAVATFMQVVQTSNLTSLVDLLDEDMVDFIRVLLAEAEVATSESDLLQRFAAAYPTRVDGRVLLRFPRLFIVAVRG